MSDSFINVGIRLRPLNSREIENNGLYGWSVTDGKNIQTIEGENQNTQHFFSFDRVFGEDVSGTDIYNTMGSDIIDSCLKGVNGTIFAYGQTSSGKTFTMTEIINQSVEQLFLRRNTNAHRRFKFTASYTEIYNEMIHDLFNPKNNKTLKIKESLKGVIVHGLSEEEIHTAEMLHQLLQKSEENRHVGSTCMNDKSSRSHTIVRIQIESAPNHEAEIDNSLDNKTYYSTLNLVDLAGSERVSQTKAKGIRLKEGGHINKSLLTLSTVIRKLSQEGSQAHIPYRDSRLTRILQPALGGNSRTAIICCITPCNLHKDETVSTLGFAVRAKCIQNKVRVQEVLDEKTQIRRLKEQITKLKKRLSSSGEPIEQKSHEIYSSDSKCITSTTLTAGNISVSWQEECKKLESSLFSQQQAKESEIKEITRMLGKKLQEAEDDQSELIQLEQAKLREKESELYKLIDELALLKNEKDKRDSELHKLNRDEINYLEEISEYQRKEEEWIEERSKFDDRVQLLQKQREEAYIEIQELEDEMDEKEMMYNDVQEAYKKEVEANRQRMAEISKEQSLAVEEKGQLRTELILTNQSLESLKAEMDEQEETYVLRMQENRNMINSLENQLEMKSNELDLIRSELENIKNMLTEKNERINQLIESETVSFKEIEELKSNLMKQEKNHLDMVNNLTKSLNEKENEHITYCDQSEKDRKQLILEHNNAIKKNNDEHESKLEAFEIEYKNVLTETNLNCDAKILTLEEQNNGLKSQIKFQEEKYIAVQAAHLTYIDDINEKSKNAYENQKRIILSLEDDKEDLLEMVQQLEKNVENESSTHDHIVFQLKSENTELLHMLEACRNQLRLSNEENKSQRIRLEHEKQESNEIVKQFEDRISSITLLNEQAIQHSREENIQLHNSLQALQNQMDETNASLSYQIKVAKDDKEILLSELSEVNDEVACLQETVEELSNEQSLERQNLGTFYQQNRKMYQHCFELEQQVKDLSIQLQQWEFKELEDDVVEEVSVFEQESMSDYSELVIRQLDYDLKTSQMECEYLNNTIATLTKENAKLYDIVSISESYDICVTESEDTSAVDAAIELFNEACTKHEEQTIIIKNMEDKLEESVKRFKVQENETKSMIQFIELSASEEQKELMDQNKENIDLLASKNAENEALVRHIESFSEQVLSLEKKLSVSCGELETITNREHNLRQELERYHRIMQSKHSEDSSSKVLVLQGLLDERENELATLNEQLIVASLEMEAVKAHAAEKEKVYAHRHVDAQRLIDSRQEEIDFLNRDILSLRSALSQANQDIALMSTQAEENNEVTKEFTASMQSLGEMKQKCLTLKRKCDASEQEITSLKSANVILQGKVAQLTTSQILTDQSVQINAIKEQLFNAEKDAKKFRERSSKLSARLTTLQQSLKESRVECKKLQNVNDLAQLESARQIETLEEELENKHAEYEALEKKIPTQKSILKMVKAARQYASSTGPIVKPSNTDQTKQRAALRSLPLNN